MNRIKTYFYNLPIGVKWIVGLNLGIYIITLLIKLILNESPQDYFGAYPTYSENFNIFSVFTSMFIHSFDPSHIISNMVFMLIFAPFVEKVLGFKQFIVSYIVMGLIGFMFINYAYNKNKILIEKSIVNVGVDVQDIKVVDGSVSKDYLNTLNETQAKVVVEYNHVISKTYGASSSLFGVVILYLLFTLLRFKKIILIILGGYLILNSLYNNLNSGVNFNGSEFAHLGGMIGGVLVFIQYKLKKGIN